MDFIDKSKDYKKREVISKTLIDVFAFLGGTQVINAANDLLPYSLIFIPILLIVSFLDFRNRKLNNITKEKRIFFRNGITLIAACISLGCIKLPNKYAMKYVNSKYPDVTVSYEEDVDEYGRPFRSKSVGSETHREAGIIYWLLYAAIGGVLIGFPIGCYKFCDNGFD
ncbi:MAG: hypothetical protein ABI169_16140 [Chitinophagaceae bacterium]